MFFLYNLLSLYIYTTSDYEGFLVIVEKNKDNRSVFRGLSLCDSLSWILPLVFAWNHFWLSSLPMCVPSTSCLVAFQNLCPCLCCTIVTERCVLGSLVEPRASLWPLGHIQVLSSLKSFANWPSPVPTMPVYLNLQQNLFSSKIWRRTPKCQGTELKEWCSLQWQGIAAPGSCNLGVGREKSGSRREGSRLSGTISAFERQHLWSLADITVLLQHEPVSTPSVREGPHVLFLPLSLITVLKESKIFLENSLLSDRPHFLPCTKVYAEPPWTEEKANLLGRGSCIKATLLHMSFLPKGPGNKKIAPVIVKSAKFPHWALLFKIC